MCISIFYLAYKDKIRRKNNLSEIVEFQSTIKLFKYLYLNSKKCDLCSFCWQCLNRYQLLPNIRKRNERFSENSVLLFRTLKSFPNA